MKQARNASFAVVNEKDIFTFEMLVGVENVIRDEEVLQAYNLDFTKKYRGNSKLVLTPTTSEQVSEVLRYCNMHKIAVTP